MGILKAIDRSLRVQIVATAALCLTIALAFPPAFWLCGVGLLTLALSISAQGRRTGQTSWLPWRENDTSLSPAELRWALIAGVMIAVPLAVALVEAARN